MRRYTNFSKLTNELYAAVSVFKERLDSKSGCQFMQSMGSAAIAGEHLVVEKTGKVQGRYVDE